MASELDLMHEEFVRGVGGIDADRFGHLGDGGFRAVTQGGGFVVWRRGHAVLLLVCSVVATA